MDTNKQLSGVYVASVTPLNNGAIDEPMLIRHLQQLETDGVDGVLLMGTTGEGTSFSLSEKIRAVEIAVENVSLDIMVGTGTPSLTDTIDATKQLLAAGASNALVLPPYYFKNLSDDGLFDYFKALFDNALKGGDEGILLYHIPQVTKIHMSHELLVRVSEYAGEKFKGVKDSSGDIDYSRKIVQQLPHLSVFVGRDSLFLENLNFGGSGCITAALNVLAPAGAKLYRAWKDGDQQTAQSFQAVLNQGIELLSHYQPAAASLKGVLANRYQSGSFTEVRPPLSEFSQAEIEQFTGQLKALTQKD